jgi:hypothetical protein
LDPRYKDVDLGGFRSSIGLEEQAGAYLNALKVFAEAVISMGNIALLNEPGIYGWASQRYRTLVVVPSFDRDEAYRRAVARNQDNFGPTLWQNFDDWVAYWKTMPHIEAYHLSDVVLSRDIKESENLLGTYDGWKNIWIDRVRDVMSPIVSRYYLLFDSDEVVSRLKVKGINIDTISEYVNANGRSVNRGKEILWGSAREARDICELDAIWMRGNSCTLVDGAGYEEMGLFEFGEGNYGIHASTGSFDGKFFDNRSEPQAIDTVGEWTLMRQDERLHRIYLDSIRSGNYRGQPVDVQAMWRIQWVQRIHGTHIVYGKSRAAADWSRIVGYQVISDEPGWDMLSDAYDDDLSSLKLLMTGGDMIAPHNDANAMKRQFGNHVRSTLMLWCYRNGKKYIGIGDEVESVVMSYNLGIPSEHWNLRRPTEMNVEDVASDSEHGLECYEILMERRSSRGIVTYDRDVAIDSMAKGTPVTWVHKRSRKYRHVSMPRAGMWTFAPINGLYAYTYFQGIDELGVELHKKSPIYMKRLNLNGRRQSRAIIELAIRVGRGWRESNGILVSIFAISNVSNYVNGVNDDLDFIRTRDHIVLLPHKGAASWWNSYHEIVVTDALYDRDFRDVLHTPRDGYSWTLPNALWGFSKSRISEYGDISTVWHSGHSWDHSDPLSWLWYIETNLLPSTSVESMIQNQTWNVKFWTGILREVLHHTKKSLHVIRARAVENAGGIAEYDAPRINGIYHGEPVTVAGHLVNLLIASNFVVIDFGRWLNSVEGNIAGRSAKTVFEDAEKHELWHSLDEWLLAISAYKLMAKEMNLEIDEERLLYISDGLSRIFQGHEARLGREVERIKREESDDYRSYLSKGVQHGQRKRM